MGRERKLKRFSFNATQTKQAKKALKFSLNIQALLSHTKAGHYAGF